jgi:hypothetical protein
MEMIEKDRGKDERLYQNIEKGSAASWASRW